MDWTQSAEIATKVAAATAVLLAYLQYRRSVRTRRAEWLSSLHEKFFESGRYEEIRQVLDYSDEPSYVALESAVRQGTFNPLANELYRYLNFFELLASLRRLGQISDKEILALFEYDLRMITRHGFIIDALAPQGFERLPELLRSTRLLPQS
ncbi:MAG TPA: hypothetical protein VG454_03770 [Gemmatimonadales bacterium]|nr:hypothetical protein [Gemmatimonadales bacterium]